MFIRPKTRIISKNAVRIPCNDIFAPIYESTNPKLWIKIKKEGNEIVHPPKVDEHSMIISQINITHNSIDFGLDGRIYTREQIEDTQKYLFIGILKRH